MLENEYYKISIEEIEKYIIMKKIENMSLEEIKNWIESQSQIIIIKDCIIEKKDKEINNLQSKIEKANEYLEEHFIFDDENEEYYQTHTFDKCNAKELHDILKENK